MMAINETERTDHGNAIANQIQSPDAYGHSGPITASDLWNLLDVLETHFMETEREKLCTLTTKWKQEVEQSFPDIETI